MSEEEEAEVKQVEAICVSLGKAITRSIAAAYKPSHLAYKNRDQQWRDFARKVSAFARED